MPFRFQSLWAGVVLWSQWISSLSLGHLVIFLTIFSVFFALRQHSGSMFFTYGLFIFALALSVGAVAVPIVQKG